MLKKGLFIILFLITSALTFSQSKFESLEFLIGNWQGIESGAAGNGIGFRTYRFDLNNNFIFAENTSTFPKSEKKPKGEVHRDKSVFSFNNTTKKTVLREFFSEGFTIIYELDDTQSSASKIVFVSREIENNPGNWKAKLIFTKDSDTSFSEAFLIAFDGENFSPFIQNNWFKVD